MAQTFNDKRLLLLFIIELVLALSMNLINPIWPLFIQSLGATVFQVSVVVSMMGIAGTLLRVPSGIISDKVGREKIVIVSVLLAIFPPLIYTLSTKWEQLIPWGMLYSSAFALFVPSSMAMIADYASAEKRITIYSVMNLTWPTGSLIGPFLGGFLADLYGWNATFYLVTATLTLDMIPAVYLFGKRTKTRETILERKTTFNSYRLDRSILYPLISLILSHFLIGLGLGLVNSIIPIYLTRKFQIGATQVGLFFTIGFGLITFFTQVPAGFLCNKYSRKKVILSSLLPIPILFVLWPNIDNYFVVLAAHMAINGLWSITWPGAMSLLMDITPSSKRGVVSGVYQASLMLGFSVMGPVIGGYLWETLGSTAPFYSSAVSFALCIPTVFLLKEKPANYL